MTNKLWLIIILILIIGCQSEPIDNKYIIGTFYHIENSDDYNYLNLKEDNTFDFVQAKHHSCELWSQEYGSWEIEEKKLILNKGIDLDSLINTKKEKNLSTDTLTIKFTNSFLNEFPKIKVRIGLDTFDREIIDNQIVLDKAKYSLENELFQFSNDDKETNYDSGWLKVVLKEDGYFIETNYILSYGEINYDLGNFKKEKTPKEKYIEYQKKNGILISSSYEKWIHNHKLMKKEI